MPVSAFAQTQSPVALPANVTTIAGFYDLFCGAVNWIFAFVMVLAVFALIFAGLKFMTSGGSEEGVASARRYFFYALIGVAVAALARSLVLTSGNFLGADLSAAVACF